MFKRSVILAVFISLFSLALSGVYKPEILQAQTCTGSVTCCSVTNTISQPTPAGCGCLGCPACTGWQTTCSNSGESYNCTFGGSSNTCGLWVPDSLCNFQMSGGCVSNSCPGSQIFCGAQGSCAASCRDTGGLTCQQWLNANCGGPTPTPAPGCTPSCNQPLCGQNNGCGGTCATTDGVQSLNTPTILTNRPTHNAEYQSPVRIDWFNVSNAHRYRVVVERIDGGGTFTLVHDDNSYIDSEVYLPLPTGYYRTRVRATQKWNAYGQCSPSDWSAYRRFYIVDPPPLCGNGVCAGGETCSTCPADCGACACVPDCSGAQCGQDDGCSGTCPNTDGATLPAPTLTSPADDALVVATGTDPKVVQLSITKTNAASLRIEVYPYGTSCFHGLAKCETIVNASPAGTVVNYNYTVPLASYGSSTRFQWRVTHENLLCGGGNETYSSWREFTMAEEIEGDILIDDLSSGLSGGSCISPYAPRPYTPDGVEEIQASYGGTDYLGTINGDGTYSVRVPVSSSGIYNVEFISNKTADQCGCPGGCTYNSIESPRTNLNFYYQPVLIRDPWWQTINGHIFAGTSGPYAITSEIPDTCFGICLPFLSLLNADSDEDSTGVIISGGGAVDVSNEAGSQADQIDEEGQNQRATGISFSGVIENYSYFYRLYSMGDTTTTDLPGGGQKPTAPPLNGRAYYYEGNYTLSQFWDVSAAEEIVVFVNGNLSIENNIQVAEGGFLSFIVNGDITFGEDVCQNDHTSTEAVIEGVFVADEDLTVASRGNADCRFVAEGIFVGWNNINLERDFRTGLSDEQDGWNAYFPVELIRYRPDFVVNLPERMARSLYFWQEVAP